MKTGKRGVAILLAILTMLALCPIQALAAGKVDPSRDVALNISYMDYEKPVSNAKFSLYKVASVDEYARMSLTAEFEAYKEKIQDLSNLEDLDQDKWLALASTLKGEVNRDKLTPTASGKTDKEGKLSLSVKPGLYLVLGNRVTHGNYAFTAIPSMLFLPALDEIENEWVYEEEISPKYKKSPVEPVVTRKVIKVWDDSGYESIRPNEVSVNLLCDGEVYESVKLNEQNNWRYTWEKLDDKCEWTLTEDKVEGYSVSITQKGNTFTVKNTYGDEDILTDPPVYKRIVGDTPEKEGTFTFVLTAKDRSCPMPEGSTGLTKEITISGAGKKEFGDIKFTGPGTFVYTVSEKDTNEAGYTYDNTVYTITYKVIREGISLRAERTITTEKGKSAERLEFTNRFGKKIPQTGMLWWPIPVLLVVGLVFILVGIKINRRHEG